MGIKSVIGTRNESNSHPGAATPSLRAAGSVLLACATLMATGACGGVSPDADPLASLADEVSEERRSPAPLAQSWLVEPDEPLTLAPAVGTVNVYLAQGDQLIALNASTGESRWAPIDFDSPLSAAPVAIDQQVIVATRGTASLPAAIWWFDSDGNLLNRVTVQRPVVQISAAAGYVLYIDGESVGRLGGGVEWTAPVDEPRSVDVSAELGLAYVTTGAGVLLAVDVSDGSSRWQHDAGSAISRAVVGGQRIFFGDAKGTLSALAATSGDLRWRRELGTSITGAPAVAQDLLWVAAQDAKLRALKASNGTEMEGTGWLVELSSRNYLPLAAFEQWVIVGPAYGPWLAVRGPTRYETSQSPTRVTVQQPNAPPGARLPDLSLAAGSGPAGVALINNDGAVVFLQPRRSR